MAPKIKIESLLYFSTIFYTKGNLFFIIQAQLPGKMQDKMLSNFLTNALNGHNLHLNAEAC